MLNPVNRRHHLNPPNRTNDGHRSHVHKTDSPNLCARENRAITVPDAPDATALSSRADPPQTDRVRQRCIHDDLTAITADFLD